eukprot:TRINITY_DN14280_c0_g1_i1.p1 TRINITY_DN14280_c0_g1~~TRINITY_DN14280_c0_g1_i1.p1  ORF type:complete len:435 (+),score=103.10 TRINITY_DN14280_c0_g1_i1:94-1305(+)
MAQVDALPPPRLIGDAMGSDLDRTSDSVGSSPMESPAMKLKKKKKKVVKKKKSAAKERAPALVAARATEGGGEVDTSPPVAMAPAVLAPTLERRLENGVGGAPPPVLGPLRDTPSPAVAEKPKKRVSKYKYEVQEDMGFELDQWGQVVLRTSPAPDPTAGRKTKVADTPKPSKPSPVASPLTVDVTPPPASGAPAPALLTAAQPRGSSVSPTASVGKERVKAPLIGSLGALGGDLLAKPATGGSRECSPAHRHRAMMSGSHSGMSRGGICAINVEREAGLHTRRRQSVQPMMTLNPDQGVGGSGEQGGDTVVASLKSLIETRRQSGHSQASSQASPQTHVSPRAGSGSRPKVDGLDWFFGDGDVQGDGGTTPPPTGPRKKSAGDPIAPLGLHNLPPPALRGKG